MKGRLIGFDYGTQRIGIATGNLATGTAQALTTVSATPPGSCWGEIDAVIEEWLPDILLVGLPLTMQGEESPTSTLARKFAQTLNTRYQLQTELVDERLTSSEADHLLSESAANGKSRAKTRQNVRDSLAAELIVRTYLNDNRDPA